MNSPAKKPFTDLLREEYAQHLEAAGTDRNNAFTRFFAAPIASAIYALMEWSKRPNSAVEK